MIQIPAKIDVGQLKSILLQRRITKPRFRLPMSPQQAYDSLLAATIAEVEYRCRSFQENVDVKAQLQQIANWLTSDSSKFGILLCGECGNGKSTLVKAFQQLLNLLSIPNPTGQATMGFRLLTPNTLPILPRPTTRHSYNSLRRTCSALMTLAPSRRRSWILATWSPQSLTCSQSDMTSSCLPSLPPISHRNRFVSIMATVSLTDSMRW